MKNRILWKWTLGLALGVLPFAGGCLQQDNTNGPAVQNGAAITTIAEADDRNAVPEIAVEESEVPPLTNLVEAAVHPLSTNVPTPPAVKLTEGAAELVRMANSGVDEAVMLTYVTNSTSTFNLGADEIIYMNDLGVPGTVVTAMIQQDRTLKAAGMAALLSASVVTNVPLAAAETPAPEDVAPQGTPPPEPTEAAPAGPPQSEVTDATFNDSLAPYGTWVYVSGYGRCWRPTVAVVNPGWGPYLNGGRWVYTDWGWYWVSDYSWGWAPFHYGRWFRHNHWGWCWAPGTVWGPAWVSWRYSNDYCGWAPLPPGAYFSVGFGLTYHGHYSHGWDDWGCGPHYGHFVAWRHFHHRGLHNYHVDHHRGGEIYRTTVAANHVTVNNNVVINRGVPRERVAQVTQRDIRPVSIRETTTTVVGGRGRPTGRPEQLRGNTLTVYRPAMPHPTRTTGTDGTTATRTRPLGRNGSGSALSTPSAERSPSTPRVGERTSETVSRPGTSLGTQGRPQTSATRQQPPTVTSRPVPSGTSPAGSTDEPGATASRSPIPRTGTPRLETGGRSTVQTIHSTTPPAAQSTREAVPARTSPLTRPEIARRPETGNGRSPLTAPPSPNSRSTVTPETRPGSARPEVSRQPATPSVQAPGRTSALDTRPSPLRPSPVQASTPTPSVPQPQRSFTAPQPTPRQSPIVNQVPRYTPSPTPSASVPQRSVTPTPAPSSSRPEPAAPRPAPPSVSSTPRNSAPAPSAASSESRSGQSSSRSGGGGGGGRR